MHGRRTLSLMAFVGPSLHATLHSDGIHDEKTRVSAEIV